MLHGLLNDGLQGRIAVLDFSHNATHLGEVEPTEEYEERGGNDEHQCHGGIERIEINKGKDELGNHRHQRRQHFGEEIDDVGHVTKQTVQYISTMIFLNAIPMTIQKAREKHLLHLVLRLHTQHCPEPGGQHIQGDFHHKNRSKNRYHHPQIALLLMRGNVSDLSQDIHIVQTDEHLKKSHHHVHNHLHTTAFVVLPQPRANLFERIFSLV